MRPAPPASPASVPQRAARRLRELTEGLRRQDRFFKMRAGIVGAWALVSAVTLWAACPPSGSSNPLGADVRVLADALVGGEQIMVRNESDDIWKDVKLTLDGRWRHERATVRPHDQLVLAVGQFREDGQPPPRDFRPRALTVECSQGSHTFELR